MSRLRLRRSISSPKPSPSHAGPDVLRAVAQIRAVSQTGFQPQRSRRNSRSPGVSGSSRRHYGEGAMARYQIRDDAFGLALIEAPTTAATMHTFLSWKVRAALQPGDYKIANY